MNKKIIIIISIIILTAFGYYFRYIPFSCMQKFYNYRIDTNIKKGDYIKAEKLLKNKLFLSRDFFDKDNTINEMIRFYSSQRMYNKAEELYLKKIESNIFSPAYGFLNSNPKINKANMYNEISGLYINMENFKEASKFSRKALDEIENSKTTDKIILGTILAASYENLGYINLENKNPVEAKKYFEKIQEVLAKYGVCKEKGQEALFNYYKSLMIYYLEIKDYKNAENYAKKLYFSTPKTILPESAEWLLQSRYSIFINQNLGKIYYAQEKFPDAERAFAIAYKISNELNGEYDPSTVCNSYYLSTVYKIQGRNGLYERHAKKVRKNIKNFIIMQNKNDNDFEENADNFCKTWNP